MSARTIEKERYYSAEEFMKLRLDPNKRYELVNGVIKEMSQPGPEHGMVAENLQLALGVFIRAKGLGRFVPPISFKLPPGDKGGNVRAPDLAFVAKGKLNAFEKATQTISDLAVEIYSSEDEPGDYRKKFLQYRAAGWNLVWLIYPPNFSPKKKAGKVKIYHLQESLEPVTTLERNQNLEDKELLPGFTMLVADLFNYD